MILNCDSYRCQTDGSQSNSSPGYIYYKKNQKGTIHPHLSVAYHQLLLLDIVSKISLDRILKFARNKLVFQHLVRLHYSHRNQIQKTLRSPNLRVQLLQVGSPDQPPTPQHHPHKQTTCQYYSQSRVLHIIHYCTPNSPLNFQHRGLNVFSHNLSLHSFGGNETLRHCSGVLSQGGPHVLQTINYCSLDSLLKNTCPHTATLCSGQTLVKYRERLITRYVSTQISSIILCKLCVVFLEAQGEQVSLQVVILLDKVLSDCSQGLHPQGVVERIHAVFSQQQSGMSNEGCPSPNHLVVVNVV